MSRLINLYHRIVRRRMARLGVRSTFYGTEGERLHVYEYEGASDGLDFVVVHGLGADAAAYAPVIERLLPHARRLWAPELPGHGFSELPTPIPAPDESLKMVAQRLDALIEKPVVLVGTSLGGAVAMKYALHSPDKVERLVLVSPAGAPLSNEGMDGLRDLFKMDSVKGARHFLRRLYHQPPWYTPIIAVPVRAALNRPIVKRFLDMSPETSFLRPEEVQSLRMDTLLLWGASERILPKECLLWYREHMPERVTIEEPDNFGHAPHLEVPDALVARILKFTGRVSA